MNAETSGRMVALVPVSQASAETRLRLVSRCVQGENAIVSKVPRADHQAEPLPCLVICHVYKAFPFQVSSLTSCRGRLLLPPSSHWMHESTSFSVLFKSVRRRYLTKHEDTWAKAI